VVKTLLALLLSAGKLGKFATTGLTMVVSVFAYAFVFGLWYAVGFVLLILVHELGHYVAARQRGLEVGAPTFIPFVGAWIQLKDLPHDAETEAYVGIAGPVAGTAAALACYFLARHYDSQFLLALAYAGFFLNLFNLIPVSPLDGGRVTAILSPRVWLLGVPILAGLFLWRPSPMLVLIAILAAPQLWRALHFDPQAPENQAYYAVTLEQRVSYGVFYLGLAAYLAVMTYDVHEMLGGARHAARG
jgi:Zn-dependent protease